MSTERRPTLCIVAGPNGSGKTTMTIQLLESEWSVICPQLVEQLDKEITQQLVEQIGVDIFSIPWGHYCRIIDKYKDSPSTALFYVRKEYPHP